jgi:chromosome partitioning protein
MIVTIANLKGGAGKTTAAVHLAAEAHARGLRVLLCDADPQRSALTWAAVATEAGHDGPSVVGVSGNLHATVPKMAKDYDLAIVDAPPRGDAMTRAAVVVADVTVIPIGPSPVDVWAAGATVAIVREAEAMRPGLRASVLLTRLQARQSLSAQAREATEALGLPVLAATLGLRTPFAEALAAGEGVATYAPASTAADEVRALLDELVPRASRKGRRAA